MADTTVADIGGRQAVLPDGGLVERVIADGAYDRSEGTGAMMSSGIVPVIAPPSHAVSGPQETGRWHDRVVGYIRAKGVHAFQKKYGDGQRALIEAQISRIKRCIGARRLTRRTRSQDNEGVAIANLINRWNAFGWGVCAKNGSLRPQHGNADPSEPSRRFVAGSSRGLRRAASGWARRGMTRVAA